MAKTIRCGISSKDFRDAAKQIRKYNEELKIKQEMIVRTLSEYGVVIARSLLLEMDAIDTGHLSSSIAAIYDPLTKTGFVRVNCDYAVFVEFGTGVKGAASPYMGEAINKVAYKYGSGTHYVILNDGRVGWYFPADDGTFKFTQGMPSRPFMYDTARDLHNRVIEIARSVFQ